MTKSLLRSFFATGSIISLWACDSAAVNSTVIGQTSGRASMTIPANDPASQAMRQCIAEIAARDPVMDARRDAAAGERRLFAPPSEPATFLQAPGLRGCTFPVGDEVPQRRAFFNRYDFRDESARADLRAECGLAIQNYKAAYNRALAQIAPESIQRSCMHGSGRIDPRYRPNDLEDFRRRMREIYGE